MRFITVEAYDEEDIKRKMYLNIEAITYIALTPADKWIDSHRYCHKICTNIGVFWVSEENFLNIMDAIEKYQGQASR